MSPHLQEFVDAIYKLGFPVFVAAFLLLRVDVTLRKQVELVQIELGLLRDIRNAHYMGAFYEHEERHHRFRKRRRVHFTRSNKRGSAPV